MAKKTYEDKLKDPRWQKMRLEVMQRDGFKCRCCDSSTVTLNVHHYYYHKGHDPWEYDIDGLITLCDLCHKAWHEIENLGYEWSTLYKVSKLALDVEMKIVEGKMEEARQEKPDLKLFGEVLDQLQEKNGLHNS